MNLLVKYLVIWLSKLPFVGGRSDVVRRAGLRRSLEASAPREGGRRRHLGNDGQATQFHQRPRATHWYWKWRKYATFLILYLQGLKKVNTKKKRKDDALKVIIRTHSEKPPAKMPLRLFLLKVISAVSWTTLHNKMCYQTLEFLSVGKKTQYSMSGNYRVIKDHCDRYTCKLPKTKPLNNISYIKVNVF